jgi:hypothetical protein
MCRFYLGCENQLSVEFNYSRRVSTVLTDRCLQLYSIVFMSARKKSRILELFRFRNFG